MSYLPEYAWRTIVNNVAVVASRIYTLDIKNINPNDPGANGDIVSVGFYLMDYVGHYYSITEINVGGVSGRIKVYDDFNVGIGPQQGRKAYVYKSVGEGYAPYLAPVRLEELDLSAQGYALPIEKDILWKSFLRLDQTNLPQTVFGGQPIFDEGFKLGLTPVLSNTAGEMYHDEVWKCMSYNNGDGTISQMSQEAHIYVYNNSASNILEGQAVYDTGSGGNGIGPTTTTVALAKADRISTSNVIGVATNSIPIGSYGKVTLRGKINKINTTTFGVAGNLLYLSTTVAGGLTTVKPDAPNLAIRVGKLDINDAVNGSIEVSAVSWRDVMEISELKATQFPGISAETPIGLQDISINYTTRVVTITPPLGYFHYFTDGNGIIKKHEVVGSISFTPFADTTGVWYFYFDNNGIVAPTQIPWSDFALIVPILRIVWDNTKTPDSAKALTIFTEYHQNDTSAIDHTWKHTYGSIWLNGLDIFSNVSTGNPNADGRNTVIGLNSGSMMDDNLPFSVTNTSTPSTYWQQDLGSNTPATLNSTNSGIFKIRYKGTSDAGVVEAGTRYPFLWDTLTNRPQYVNALGVKTLVDHSYFFVYFCYGIPDGRTGNTIRLTPAYNQYATSTEADAVTWETVQTQDPASKDNEIRPLYKLVFEYKNGFDVGCNSTALRKIVDIRKGVVTQSVSSAGSILASSVIYTPFTGISSTNVQSLGLELYNKFQGTLNTLPKYNATGITDSKFTDDGTTPKYASNTLWHSGNDGAGSGLDADTIDSIQSSGLFKLSANYVNLDTYLTNNDLNRYGWTNLGLPSGVGFAGYLSFGTEGDKYGGQIAVRYDSPELWYRQISNGATVGWTKAWDNRNLNLPSIDFTAKDLTVATAKIGTLAGYLKGTSGVVGAVSSIPESDISFTDITTGNVSTSKHGYFPKLPNTGTKFWRDDGTWQSIDSGGGGVDTFLELTDTPYSYLSYNNSLVNVNSSGNQLSFNYGLRAISNGFNINGGPRGVVSDLSYNIGSIIHTGGFTYFNPPNTSGESRYLLPLSGYVNDEYVVVRFRIEGSILRGEGLTGGFTAIGTLYKKNSTYAFISTPSITTDFEAGLNVTSLALSISSNGIDINVGVSNYNYWTIVQATIYPTVLVRKTLGTGQQLI